MAATGNRRKTNWPAAALVAIRPAPSSLYIDWLGETMLPGQTVAVDGAMLGLANARLLQRALGAQVLLRTDIDLLQQVWRPVVIKMCCLRDINKYIKNRYS